jgi:hypothetical protein
MRFAMPFRPNLQSEKRLNVEKAPNAAVRGLQGDHNFDVAK